MNNVKYEQTIKTSGRLNEEIVKNTHLDMLFSKRWALYSKEDMVWEQYFEYQYYKEIIPYF